VYLLDTNALIYYLQNEHPVVLRIEELLQHNAVLTSSIVEAELLSWPKLTEKDQKIIIYALSTIPVIPVHLLDAIIAATALKTNATLLTRNSKDFQKIKELKIEKI